MLKFAVMRRILFGIICAAFLAFAVFDNAYAHDLPGDTDFVHRCELNEFLEVDDFFTGHECRKLADSAISLLESVSNTDGDMPGVIIFVGFNAALDEEDPTASIIIQNRSDSPVTYGGPNQFLYPKEAVVFGITLPRIPLQNFIDLHSSTMNNNGELLQQPVNTVTIPPMNTRIIRITVSNRNLGEAHSRSYFSRPGSRTTTPNTSSGGGSSGSSGGSGVAIAVGAVAVIGGLAWLLWDGNPDAFTFSPKHSFNFDNDNGYALHYGSRLDFTQDKWRMYWTASQNNRRGESDKINYGSGAKYDSGFWATDFNNSIYGENTRMDFALKANAEFGLWKVSPQYRADYVSNENGEEWVSHALLAAGEWRRDRWTLTPSAGLNWNAFDEFGDNVRAKVLIVRDL